MEGENTAHITKMSIEGLVAVASLAGAITVILIATKVIAGPASLALIARPAGIAVLFIAAIYFAALSYSSYQQMNAMEGAKGKDGVNGKDADFSVLLGDAVKSGTIVEENQQLSLKLSKDDYQALTKGKSVDDEITLNVLLTSKSVEVKFKHVGAVNDNGNYQIQLTSAGGKDDLASMKTELGMNTDKSLTVAVSDKDLEVLKNGVSTKLGEVAVNAAISKVTSK